MPSFRIILVPLVAVLASACAVSPGEGQGEEEASTTTSALESGLSAGELESIISPDARAAVESMLAAEGKAESKKGCRTKTRDPVDPNVVHVVLTNCTGRLGRHVVNGEMRVTFSQNPDGSLHAEHESVSLTIDGRPATRKASSDITFEGSLKRVVRRGVKTGISAKGVDMTKETDEVILVDRATRCRTIDGTGIATFADGRKVETTIAALRICEDEAGNDLCPTGSVTHVNAQKGKTVVQRFDGSDVATIDTTTKKARETSTWDLSCAAAP
ncbi:MAG: hypothetical protein U0183_22965 [Polyangiaceae bacterium]